MNARLVLAVVDAGCDFAIAADATPRLAGAHRGPPRPDWQPARGMPGGQDAAGRLPLRRGRLAARDVHHRPPRSGRGREHQR